MAENGIILTSYGRGTPLPACMSPLLDEARRAVAGEADPVVRSKIKARIDGLRNGNADFLTFTLDGTAVGIISCEAYGDDVQLAFGYVPGAYEDQAAGILQTAVRHLEKHYRVVRSPFKWPCSADFSSAAMAMGFKMVERMDMTRPVDDAHPVRPLSEGLEVVPYSAAYFEGVARLMCETADPLDRIVLPLFASVDGCRTLLGQMLGGTFGAFQPGLSFAALDGGRLAGYLLTASYGAGVVHIDDIAVSPESRGKGLASAMMDRLIRDGGKAGFQSVLLTVTSSNRDALQLYRHKGFAVKEAFRQHIYVSNGK
jgi:ribosomal protein S18 acetylase RimI-like enzyme